MKFPRWITEIEDEKAKERALMAYATFEEAKASATQVYERAVTEAVSERERKMLKARADFDDAKRLARERLEHVKESVRGTA